MREIVLVYSYDTPGWDLRQRVFKPIREACPAQAYTVNGGALPEFMKQYDIKTTPCILFLDDGKRAGLAVRTMPIDKIIDWLNNR